MDDSAKTARTKSQRGSTSAIFDASCRLPPVSRFLSPSLICKLWRTLHKEGVQACGMAADGRSPEQRASSLPSGQHASCFLTSQRDSFLPSGQPLSIFWFPLLAATATSLPAPWRGGARFGARRPPSLRRRKGKAQRWVDPRWHGGSIRSEPLT
jgi:hypothetical protein